MLRVILFRPLHEVKEMVLPPPLVIHDGHIWLLEWIKPLVKARIPPRPFSHAKLVCCRSWGFKGLLDPFPALNPTAEFYRPTP